MIIQITVRNGLRKKDISFNSGEDLETVSDLLNNPETAAQIGAPEGAAIRVNGGQVDPDVYALQTGDELVFEQRATEKN